MQTSLVNSQQTSVNMMEEKREVLKKERTSGKMVDTMVKEGEGGGVTTLLLGGSDEKDCDRTGN